ncbi:MAG: flagellar biosynthesis anti-sigma factor FlgM [Methylophilaceae bacterium]|nr:flagellar biosynthesis anti-sigma factor FlgM [Methylophilaceae bacterium]
MKIDDKLPKVASTITDKIDKSNRKTAEPTSTTTGRKAGNVTLSPMSSQLQSLEATMASDNVFDADKVESIKAAISNGSFKINASKVAGGLISTVKDLVAANKI